MRNHYTLDAAKSRWGVGFDGQGGGGGGGGYGYGGGIISLHKNPAAMSSMSTSDSDASSAGGEMDEYDGNDGTSCLRLYTNPMISCSTVEQQNSKLPNWNGK